MSELNKDSGPETKVMEDGSIVYTSPYLESQVVITEHPSGKIKKEFEDGSIVVIEPFGSTTTYLRDGSTFIERPDGSTISLPLD